MPIRTPLLTLLASAMLTGCFASLGDKIVGENVLACAVSRDKLFVVSEWLDGTLNFGTKIRKSDTDTICNPPAAK